MLAPTKPGRQNFRRLPQGDGNAKIFEDRRPQICVKFEHRNLAVKKEAMSKRGAGTSKGRRQTGVVRRRRVLNAFVIDKTYHVQGAASAAAAEELEEEESGEHRVKSEDDEDIDSDEAFDESDEERFSTFKFSGSSAKVQEVSSPFVFRFSNLSAKSSVQ